MAIRLEVSRLSGSNYVRNDQPMTFVYEAERVYGSTDDINRYTDFTVEAELVFAGKTIPATQTEWNHFTKTLTFDLGSDVINDITDGKEKECVFTFVLKGKWSSAVNPPLVTIHTVTRKTTLRLTGTYGVTDENGVVTEISLNPVINGEFVSVSAQDAILPNAPENLFVAGYSKPVFGFITENIETRFGAVLTRIEAKCEGKTYATEDFTQPFVLDAFSANGSDRDETIEFTIIDSRGYTATENHVIKIRGYSRPVLSGMSAYRSDEHKNENDEGKYLTVRASESHTPLKTINADGEEVENNPCTITAEWGIRGQDGEPVRIASGDATLIGNGTILPIKSYVVTFTATDAIGKSNTVSLIVPTPGAVFDALKGGNGFAFGKMAERAGFLDSAWEISSDGGVYAGAEPQEDGSYTYKAYMDADGNIHADGSLDVGGNATFDGGAVFNGPVIFNGGTTGGGDSGGSSAPSFIVDETLTYENGVLSVNTADAPEQDNTLPITSAAVFESVGNINALLETI